MDNKKLREVMKYAQFHIPSKLDYLAEKYPTLKWFVAQKLYSDSVVQTLIVSGCSVITDIPGNQSLLEAAKLFEAKIIEREI